MVTWMYAFHILIHNSIFGNEDCFHMRVNAVVIQ